jgi:hypothetical protein
MSSGSRSRTDRTVFGFGRVELVEIDHTIEAPLLLVRQADRRFCMIPVVIAA